jgi:acetolactate synthase-1/2/3 large subunit
VSRIPCRFWRQGCRITGKAGVALVTSGPGCSNLITGMATANSEGDPVASWRTGIMRMEESSSESNTLSILAPGMPNT